MDAAESPCNRYTIRERRSSARSRLGHRHRFVFEFKKREIGKPASRRMHLQPVFTVQKRRIHCAHPQMSQTATALSGGQREGIAIFLQALAYSRLDRSDVGERQTFFPT